MSLCWIYFLVDPRNGDVRYVGYTGRPDKRLREHIVEARAGGHNHRLHWIRELLNLGLEPIFELEESFESEDIARKEIEFIKIAKLMGWNLTNSTAGGDGVRDPSPETRAKWSKAFKGKKFTEERVAAMRLRRASPETRLRQSESAKRRVQRDPEAHRAQLVIARAGQKNNQRT